ncbi:hypothetical protein J3E64_001765 [Sphingobium sp. OAS761]|uniref:hypothetical protein n=1 Tax=Sphingobium sp. OAS761 TaxID=2817901 RepID=UPI00209EAC58|nr:hypothetical protein [Sphingobium sp. OAS761]MCP1470078.1 hypothetical protein [Sphingobium sp. OAS761]
MKMWIALAGLTVMGCDSRTPEQSRNPQPVPTRPDDSAVPSPQPAEPAADPGHARPAPASASQLAGEAIARAQWKRARNHADCAPLALLSAAGADGTPRSASFAGGWAVAFDMPGLRSAYGFAGTAILDVDREDPAAQRRRLNAQWPLMRDLSALPQPAFAGYGLMGAEPYPPDNPEGQGMQSLAYVRIGGQTCTYNVWSHISRAHLEALLENLRVLH